MPATIRLALFALALSAGVLVARSAEADMVDEPPVDCARGLRGRTSHGGPYCAPDACGPSDACEDGRDCVPRSFCMVPRTGYGRGGAFVDQTATVACTTDADCGGVGTCLPADVCLDVEGYRLRGLVMVSIGLVLFVGVGVLAVLSARARRRQ